MIKLPTTDVLDTRRVPKVGSFAPPWVYNPTNYSTSPSRLGNFTCV